MLAHLSLALLAAVQDGNCNDHTYRLVSKPGEQPDTETFEHCGTTAFVVHVKIKADGSILVLSGEAEGSISVTITTPPRCVKHVVWHSGEIHECAGELEGWHCDPKGDTAQVKLLRADPACPTVPVDLEELLAGFKEMILKGIPITLKCNELEDASDEIDDSARIRNTARIHECGSRQAPPPGGGGQFLTTPDGAVLYTHVGDPVAIDYPALLGGVGPLETSTSAQGLELILGHLLAEGQEPLVDPVQGIVAAHPAMDWIDGLTCEVQTQWTAELPGGATTSYSRAFHVTGSFRSSGDFSVEIPEIIEVQQPGPPGAVAQTHGVHAFLHRWTGLQGNIYYCEEGERAGYVYPELNGAAALPRASHLWVLPAIQRWTENPFQILRSGAAVHAVTDLGNGLLEVEQRIEWAYGPGAAQPNALAESLLGDVWSLLVDGTGPAPRVLELELRGSTGELRSRYAFDAYREFGPGVWRPSVVRWWEYTGAGELERATTLRFAHRGHPGPVPLPLSPPAPADGLWYVRIQ